MDTEVLDVVDEEAQQRQPLLDGRSNASTTISNNEDSNEEDDQKKLVYKAISQTFKSTAHLANLLPTGTVMAFQLLSPVFTKRGKCSAVSRHMAAWLVGLFGLCCFLLSFTDSFRDSSGKVRHVFATCKGLLVIDGGDEHGLTEKDVADYKLKFIDFIHAFMSILVFAAVVLFDQNVVNCLYPDPSEEIEEMIAALPMMIGVFCSILFVLFPTKRHGIGFPLATG